MRGAARKLRGVASRALSRRRALDAALKCDRAAVAGRRGERGHERHERERHRQDGP